MQAFTLTVSLLVLEPAPPALEIECPDDETLTVGVLNYTATPPSVLQGTGVSLSASLRDGSLKAGSNVIVWTATADGATDTCNYTLTIVDVTPPTITQCVPDTTIAQGSTFSLTANAVDNVDPVSALMVRLYSALSARLFLPAFVL